ncbi:MAG: hypothetical protein KBF51_05745 [Chitinophagales bacterium]|nr:hypothetical protein [Chitinophagales bacterium]
MESLIETSILVGLLYSLFTIGLSISFRVLNYPDLTLEGSAILGAAICLTTLNLNGDPYLALLLGFFGGSLAGIFTGILHLFIKVSKLLSGIITSAILFSINIRILGGKSNVRLANDNSIFTILNPGNSTTVSILILLAILVFVLLGLYIIFKMRIGYLLRILGDNKNFIFALSKNPNALTLIGLAIANGIIGLGGAILVQYKGTCDVNMSYGLLIGSFAALILSEALISSKRIILYFIFCILGTIIYSFVIGTILYSWRSDWEKYILGTDVRLFTGTLLILVTLISNIRKRKKYSLFNSDW